VVVKPLPSEEITKGGIVIPDTAKEKPQEGEVIAVGSGRLLDSGQRVAIDLRAGDKVLFSKYSGNEVKIDGVDYLIMRESDILGVVE
jgi:chaperonin GroES